MFINDCAACDMSLKDYYVIKMIFDVYVKDPHTNQTEELTNMHRTTYSAYCPQCFDTVLATIENFKCCHDENLKININMNFHYYLLNAYGKREEDAQVKKQFTISLCNTCFKNWIENLKPIIKRK